MPPKTNSEYFTGASEIRIGEANFSNIQGNQTNNHYGNVTHVSDSHNRVATHNYSHNARAFKHGDPESGSAVSGQQFPRYRPPRSTLLAMDSDDDSDDAGGYDKQPDGGARPDPRAPAELGDFAAFRRPQAQAKANVRAPRPQTARLREPYPNSPDAHDSYKPLQQQQPYLPYPQQPYPPLSQSNKPYQPQTSHPPYSPYLTPRSLLSDSPLEPRHAPPSRDCNPDLSYDPYYRQSQQTMPSVDPNPSSPSQPAQTAQIHQHDYAHKGASGQNYVHPSTEYPPWPRGSPPVQLRYPYNLPSDQSGYRDGQSGRRSGHLEQFPDIQIPNSYIPDSSSSSYPSTPTLSQGVFSEVSSNVPSPPWSPTPSEPQQEGKMDRNPFRRRKQKSLADDATTISQIQKQTDHPDDPVTIQSLPPKQSQASFFYQSERDPEIMDNIGDVLDPNKSVIAIMGAIGSGKTNFVNTASGGKLPPVGDSDGLRSRTTSIQTSPTFTVEGRSVVLIDLPGFDETTTRGVDVLSTVSVFLAEMYESDKKLAGIIYLHRISEVRMSAITLQSFRMFQELCGSESLKNVVIATTGWSEVPLEVAEAREHELMSNDLFFKSVLDGGARMVRYDNTTESAHSVLGALVEKEPLPLLIQTQVVDDNKTLAETAAGAELDVAISLMIAKLEQWIPLVKEEAEQLLVANLDDNSDLPAVTRTKSREDEVREEAARTMMRMEVELAHYRGCARKLKENYSTNKARLFPQSATSMGSEQDSLKDVLEPSHQNQSTRTSNEGQVEELFAGQNEVTTPTILPPEQDTSNEGDTFKQEGVIHHNIPEIRDGEASNGKEGDKSKVPVVNEGTLNTAHGGPAGMEIVLEEELACYKVEDEGIPTTDCPTLKTRNMQINVTSDNHSTSGSLHPLQSASSIMSDEARCCCCGLMSIFRPGWDSVIGIFKGLHKSRKRDDGINLSSQPSGQVRSSSSHTDSQTHNGEKQSRHVAAVGPPPSNSPPENLTALGRSVTDSIEPELNLFVAVSPTNPTLDISTHDPRDEDSAISQVQSDASRTSRRISTPNTSTTHEDECSSSQPKLPPECPCGEAVCPTKLNGTVDTSFTVRKHELMPHEMGSGSSALILPEEDINTDLVILNNLRRFVEDVIGDEQKLKTLLDTKGEDAQLWLDVLHVLTNSVAATTLRSSMLKVILHLSKNSGLCPQCLIIGNVDKLGDYPVAQGGFGDVWKGKIGEQDVCLKVMKVYLDSNVQQLLEDYKREAIMWQQLAHPNLLPFLGMYYLGPTREQLCLVSPWMERGNLLQFAKDTSTGRTIDHYSLVFDVASGLTYLHSRKIVHGDLKACNVMITPDERACIGDFGLSLVADTYALKLTSSKEISLKGTTRYLSPELLMGGSTPSKFSDIYAFACVCYEIFEGKIPFHALKLEASVILAVAIDKKHPSRPESTSLNDTMWNIMVNCWDADFHLRPSASEVFTDVARLESLKTGDSIKPAPDWDIQNLSQIWKNVKHPRIDVSELARLQNSLQCSAAAAAAAQSNVSPSQDLPGSAC